ncbi:MAG TPA: fatty acid desaturase [Planctomycetota bacterium]|nr:fatty acid desaturase [Planctomycetota bacterium]
MDLRLSVAQRCVEVLRPFALCVAYIIAARAGAWWLAIPLAGASCLAGFVLMHDAMHAALGLSRRANHVVMALSGLLLLKSGHGIQVTHLRHHARCLEADDPEGGCANWTLGRVIVDGPWHILALRWWSLRASPRTRWWQIAETAATVAIVGAAAWSWIAAGSLVGIAYWGVAAALSATMPLWAAYIPHHLAPRHPAIRTAATVARCWTPLVSSFAYHHVHHADPRIPTALLPAAVRRGLVDAG